MFKIQATKIPGRSATKRKRQSRKFKAKKPVSKTSGGALRALGGGGGYRPPGEEN